MTRPPLSPFLAVLTLAACGMAGAATWPGSAPLGAPGPDCALRLTRAGGLTSIVAEATARTDTAGHYGLSVTRAGGGGSALIDQGGPVRLLAGRTERLSEIAFTAPAGAIEAELTLTVDGTTRRCPVIADN